MPDPRPEPQITLLPFQGLDLLKSLEITAPPFAYPAVHRQLSYVQAYAADLDCKSIAIEWPYIDRDHIEDHSVFYSKSLYPHRNWCRRVHFFALDVDDLQRQLPALVHNASKATREEYDGACATLSAESYLGFCVMKPLGGTPVGRTVLKPFSAVPRDAEQAKRFRRVFLCSTREYRAHLLGVDLRVRGLPFQQQDVGVSACATTAIWCALQAFRNHEELAPATPAQITNLAARYSLPFGRAMPSEGLSLDQMCQAIQALGVSPNVFRVEDDIEIARGILASAINSEFSPILILQHGDTKRGHAVAVAGMKIRAVRSGEKVSVAAAPKGTPLDLRDMAGDLLGLYIHDDRRGPYLRASLRPKGSKPFLDVDGRQNEAKEAWALTHILLPMHNKVRLSFANLRDVAIAAAWRAYQDGQRINLILGDRIKNTSVSFETRIVRAHKYVENVFIAGGSAARAIKVCKSIPMARYLGIVTLTSSYFDAIDLLVDTTSTLRNIYCLGVVARDAKTPITERIANLLAGQCSCPVVL